MRAIIPILVGALLLVIVPGIILNQRVSRPLPALAVSQVLPDSSTPLAATVSLPWPKLGSAAVGVEGLGVVDSVRDDKARPIASVTKMMTAYVILKAHPLKPGDTGPMVTVSASDIALYSQLLANDESVVAVGSGETISEYDLLQGLMIPSGNNFAAMLANWDSGSVNAFVQKMNTTAAGLGMKKTTYTDASGASAGSVSTATDQVLLAEAAMQDPVFAEIVLKQQATLPVAGVVYNVDTLIGQQGIVGVKTGWTEEAGGCFVFAAKAQVDGHDVMLFGAVLGQDVLQDAFDASTKLVPTLAATPHYTKVLDANTQVASVSSKWGKQTQAIAADGVQFLLWPGMKVQTTLQPALPKAPLSAGADLGTLVVTAGSQSQTVSLKAGGSLPAPGKFWRVLH